MDMNVQHPYKKWIKTYSGQEFNDSVEKAISIFDAMAQAVSDDLRGLMLDAFYKSTVLEWHFWNDAYYQTIFDVVT